jgi:capsular polysaccharide biosynthesis protein
VTSESISQRYREVLDDWDVRLMQVAPGTVIQAEELVLVDQPELFWPRGADLRVLRDAFLSIDRATSSGTSLFVSRHGSSRALDDEATLGHSLLRDGFEEPDLASMTIVDQVALFQNAERVVGLHGAGLAGIAFMNSDSVVWEVSSGEAFEECYRRIAGVIGVNYRLLQVSGSEAHPYGEGADALAAIRARRSGTQETHS